jgi:hypothetical protein
MSKPIVTFERLEIPDNDPDLSYLEQDYSDSPADEAEKYREQDRKRLAEYRRGGWYMVGIRARANISIPHSGYTTMYSLESPGLWGIESDSGEPYFAEVFEEEKQQLLADISKLCSGYEVR